MLKTVVSIVAGLGLVQVGMLIEKFNNDEPVGPRIQTAPFYHRFEPQEKVEGYSPVIRLQNGNDFFCSGVVISNHHALTAAHCALGKLKFLRKTPIDIYTETGKTFGQARVVAINNLTDIAIIEGDFDQYQHSKVRTETYGFMVGGNYKACGYPHGQKKLICHDIQYTTNMLFQAKANGMLFPGMSGGPVYDNITNEVVGVNSAVLMDGGVLLSPTTAIAAGFGVE